MDSSDSIIDALGGTSAVAGTTGQLMSVVSGWRTRGIPAGYWGAVVALAADIGRADITLELLANLAERSRLERAARKLEQARP